MGPSRGPAPRWWVGDAPCLGGWDRRCAPAPSCAASSLPQGHFLFLPAHFISLHGDSWKPRAIFSVPESGLVFLSGFMRGCVCTHECGCVPVCADCAYTRTHVGVCIRMRATTCRTMCTRVSMCVNREHGVPVWARMWTRVDMRAHRLLRAHRWWHSTRGPCVGTHVYVCGLTRISAGVCTHGGVHGHTVHMC